MSSVNVTAAIVTYNRLDLLKESLAAVLAQTAYLTHILVINNQSTDGTKEYLDRLTDPRLIVIHASENLGGAGGFNLAVKQFITALTDDYVWLMDDDTLPEPTALEKMVSFATTHANIGFTQSQVRWRDVNGPAAYMNVVAPRAFYWQDALITPNNPAIEVVNSTFVSVMIPRERVLAVGLPQKEYFIWGDDMEYTNRLVADEIHKGYLVLNSLAVHKSKENLLPGDIITDTDTDRMWRYDYEYRNRILTARRIGKKELIKTLLRSGIRDLLKVLLKGNVAYRGKKAGIIIRGTWRGLFFKPSIESAK